MKKKYFKKALSLILTLMIVLSSMTVAAGAITIDGEEMDHLPQVYVSGFQSLKIYDVNDPEETSLFTVNFDLLLKNLKRFTEYSSESLKNGNLNIIRHYLYSAFYDTLGLYALQGDGITPVNDNIVCEEPVFEHDGDGLYTFEYDSRLDPVDIAAQLQEYILKVQEHSGSERFELVGASYGGTIVATYLNEYPEMHQYIDSCLLSVPAYKGFSVLGELYSGDFYVDHDTLTQYIDIGVENEELNLFLSVLNKSGFLKFLLEFLLLPGAKAIALDASRDLVHDTLGTIPAFWTFVQEEYFYDAMKNIYGENYNDPNHEYAGLIAKATYYQEEIMQRLDEIYTNAANNGIKMNIICKYGRPPMPISEKGSFQSDGSVSVNEVTLGATASDYGKILPVNYTQALYPEYNFISPDNIIDASTGIDPLHTWYVKGLEHSVKNAGLNELINYILYEDPDVFSDSKFPQFTEAVGEELVPVTEPDIKEKTSLMSDIVALVRRLFSKITEFFKSLFKK